MTVPQFSRPGAIDLSALRKPASPPAGGPPGAPGGGRYDFDVVGEQSLRTDVVERSMSVVVLVSFWSAAAPASVEINTTLTRLATEFGGRFLFAKVDVGAQPELAQALGIPDVPLVVAALRGQLAPLIQDPLPEQEMRALLDQVLKAAVSNGVAGVAEPVASNPAPAAAGVEDLEPAARYPEAEEAMLSGDFDAAIQGYRDALTVAPADTEALLGLARAQLLKRTEGVVPAQARQAAEADPADVAAQTLMADLDLLADQVDDAFARLIELVRRTTDADRDAARKHLVELFGVVGDADPRVLKARQNLASALF
jgi:putative thioredoxin